MIEVKSREKVRVVLKVAYITMQFPVPSETFATNDVRALRSLGIHIDIYGLRSIHPEALKLLKERDLANLKPSHSDSSTFFETPKISPDSSTKVT